MITVRIPWHPLPMDETNRIKNHTFGVHVPTMENWLWLTLPRARLSNSSNKCSKGFKPRALDGQDKNWILLFCRYVVMILVTWGLTLSFYKMMLCIIGGMCGL